MFRIVRKWEPSPEQLLGFISGMLTGLAIITAIYIVKEVLL